MRLATLLLLSLLLPTASAAQNLGSIHCNDASGVNPLDTWPTYYTPVSVTGVVTATFPTSGPNTPATRMYIQDATGGVCVFGVPQYCGDIGDLVQADGVYDQFNGLLELAEAGMVGWPKVTLISSGNPLPEPVVLTPAQAAGAFGPDYCEPNESRLVTIADVVVLDAAGNALPAGATFAGDLNYRIAHSGADRATNYTIMRLYSIAACGKTNPLIGTAVPTGVVHVTGVLNQYDSSAPYTSGYQVLPRLLTDIRPADATPTHRNTWGRLKATYR